MSFLLVTFAIAPYAALLGLFYVWLSFRVTGIRRRTGIAIGHAGNDAMERGMRAQANFNEYVPLSLLLIALAGVTGTAPVLINLLGLALVLGRLLHAYSLLVHEPRHGRYGLRVAGMVLTFSTLLIASLLILVHWLGFMLR